MIVKNRVITVSNGEHSLLDIDTDRLFKIQRELILGIDGSTSNTGIGIVDYVTGNVLGCISLKREDDESTVRYKVRFKEYMAELMDKLKIKIIFYEQPFIDADRPDSVKALFMLRTSIEEIKIEQEPRFDGIELIEVPNTKWKKVLLPDKVPNGTKAQKKAVRDFIVSALPILTGVTEDEYDGIGLGIAGFKTIRNGDANDLGATKKARPFKYNVRFIGADDDNDFLAEYECELSGYKIPKVVLDNGAYIVSINGRGIFDNHVYKEMGDDDCLLIVKFSSKHHSNVVLEHRLANLTHYNYIYAIIWRKSRHITRR